MTTTTDLDRALPLVEDADDLALDAETFAAAVREIKQRVNAGIITRDDRTEIGGELLALAESFMGYALAVLA